jgi:aryl sulfotransferase
MAITWLASYPKSGNTWMRAFLMAWQTGEVDINGLHGGSMILSRHLFDEEMGLASSELPRAELYRLRRGFHVRMAATMRAPCFVKTHEAFRLPGKEPCPFSAEASAGCVYIVRNPLDVAVSFSHQVALSVDGVIERMADPDFWLAWWPDKIAPTLPAPLSTWSGNVTSWLDQTEVPIHLVSYEAMSRDPHAAFSGVLRFAGLEVDEGGLDAAIAASRFEALRDQEAAAGFEEKADSSASFFREGQTGGWRQSLTRDQIARIVENHGPVMARLGYLDEARSFLDHS